MWLKISHSEISNITGGFTNRTYLHLYLHLHVLIKNIKADIIHKGIWSSFYLLSLLNCYSSSISVERVTSVAFSSRLFEKRKEKKIQSIVNKRRYLKKNFQGIRIILHRQCCLQYYECTLNTSVLYTVCIAIKFDSNTLQYIHINVIIILRLYIQENNSAKHFFIFHK